MVRADKFRSPIGRAWLCRAMVALLVAVVFAPRPATAEWPTTSFLPVPPGPASPDELIDSDFEPYVGDADEMEEAGGLRGLSVSKLDVTALKRGAIGALTDIMGRVGTDATRMEAAGFPAPKIEPLLRVEESGQVFYPIFWVSRYGFAGTFKHDCRTRATTFAGEEIEFTRTYRWRIFANGDSSKPKKAFPYSRLDAAWKAGGARRAQMFDYMSSQLTHEVVHGVQASGYGDDGCGTAPGWLSEGLADGTAYYLLAKRSAGVFDRETWSRNERRYDVPLDGRDTPQGSRQSIEYGAGSFYRYLMEASEDAGTDGLAIVGDILTMRPEAVRSDDRIYAELDRIIGKHSGGRTLFRIWPEFLTEYGSYGEGRYKKESGGGVLDRENWIANAFDGCVDIPIQPGVSRMKEITVRPLAGKCVKVSWSGFTQPVALQLYAINAKEGFGALHMGEAMREDSSGRHFCYEVTSQLSRRIAEPMRKKCILKRGARSLSGGTAKDEHAWTSDFNLTGSGDAHFVISNIAETPAETKPVTFKLLVGALEAENTAGGHVKPRAPAGESGAVQQGLTSIDSRVHAMNGAADRILFDGRSIFAEGVGLGFLEGVAGATGGGDGNMALVRGGDYWVGVARRPAGSGDFERGGWIVKDPDRMSSALGGGGLPMGGMQIPAPVMSVGLDGDSPFGAESCGYTIPGRFELVEDTPERMRFQVSGDLFDMMRAAMLGSEASTCEVLRAAWVEFASFEVSLPHGALHASDSRIERRTPPGQDVYDEAEFLRGPNFGGIASSRSLIGAGAPGDDPPSEPAGPSGTVEPSGSGRGGMLAAPTTCDCRCPDRVEPPTVACRAQCVPRLATCERTSEATNTETAERNEPTVEAQRKWFSRLLADQGLTPKTEAMLIEDFATMSAETRHYLIRIRKYRRGVR